MAKHFQVFQRLYGCVFCFFVCLFFCLFLCFFIVTYYQFGILKYPNLSLVVFDFFFSDGDNNNWCLYWLHARCKDSEALGKCHRGGMLVYLSRAAGWERARPGLHSAAGCVGSGMCGGSGGPTPSEMSRGCRAQQSHTLWTSCRSRSASHPHPHCNREHFVTLDRWPVFKRNHMGFALLEP